jgi:tRNA (guanine10-N2)-dimethyltransferase
VPDTVAAGLSGTFAVRFVDPQHALSNADRQRIIATIWRAHPAPRVDLRTPDHDLSVFVTDAGLWFGERLAECAPELRRSAPRRPFVRSYETPPRKARVLVNLSGAGVDHLFLDPLCGTGALVIEAARVGSNSLGADLDRVAVTGAARNASHDGATAQFFVSDSRRAPLAGGVVDAVATDLPYGRSASRRGLAGSQLYLGLLDALTATTTLGARVVVMALADDTPKRPPAPWQLAWQCIEEARTVTRNIAIWRRT